MKTIEDGQIIDGGGDNPDLEREFWEFRDELQQDTEAEGYIKVWKLPLDAQGKARANSMQQSLLFETPIGESTIDDIIHKVRTQYMDPGEYRTTVCLRGYRRGHRGIKFSKILAIERPREAPRAESPSGQPGIEQLLAIMQRNAEQQAQRTENFLREMMTIQRQNVQQLPPAPTFDPVGMMGQVAAMMGTFQTMFAGMRPPVAPAGDPLDQLTKSITALKQLNGLMGNGEKPGDSGTLEVIKAASPLIAPALQLMLQNQQAANAARRRRKPPTAAATVIAPPNGTAPGAPVESAPDSPVLVETEENAMQLKEMRKHLEDLCEYAAQDADPETVVQLLLDLLPEEFDAQLSAMVTEPETFQPKLSLILPRTKQFAPWFERLRVVLEREYTSDDDEDDEDEDDDNGDHDSH